MDNNTETPLIWTSKGNLPIDDLQYSYQWEDTPDFIKFTETYALDDEVVKQSSHIYSKLSLSIGSEQGEI